MEAGSIFVTIGRLNCPLFLNFLLECFGGCLLFWRTIEDHRAILRAHVRSLMVDWMSDHAAGRKRQADVRRKSWTGRIVPGQLLHIRSDPCKRRRRSDPAMVPPSYPTIVETTPSTLRKSSSTCQKHPPPNVAVSNFAPGVGWFNVLACFASAPGKTPLSQNPEIAIASTPRITFPYMAFSPPVCGSF